MHKNCLIYNHIRLLEFILQPAGVRIIFKSMLGFHTFMLQGLNCSIFQDYLQLSIFNIPAKLANIKMTALSCVHICCFYHGSFQLHERGMLFLKVIEFLCL